MPNLHLCDLDLNKNALLNPVIHPLGTAPSTAGEGQVYYDTGDNVIYVNTSTNVNSPSWVSMQAGDITGITAGTGMTGTATSGAVTLNVVGGTGITANANDIALTNGLIADGSNITSVGTIGTGTWNGTKIADAYLSDNTAHLAGAQTFTGAKTFTDTVALTGTGRITGIDTVNADTDAASKTYVDAHVWDGNDITSGTVVSARLDADTAHLTTAQTFTGSKTMGTTTKLNFRDANAFINSPTANDLEVVATTITLDAGADIQLEGATTVTGNLSVSGNLNVDGTTTTIDSTTVAIADSMLKLAKDQANTADALDFGFYGQYGVGGTHKYAGVFRDGSVTGDPFTFFDSLQAEPGTTVNTGGTGYDLADISAGAITSADGFTGDLTGDVTGNADTATNLVVSTSSVVSLGSIEMGDADDTTIARSAAGRVTIEDQQIATSKKFALAHVTAGVVGDTGSANGNKVFTITHGMVALRFSLV